MFSTGAALFGIAVMLGVPSLETAHTAAHHYRAAELPVQCPTVAQPVMLAENTISTLPILQFADAAPAGTGDAGPQMGEPVQPPNPSSGVPDARNTFSGSHDCLPRVHRPKRRFA